MPWNNNLAEEAHMYNIAFDSHKRYTLCLVEEGTGRELREDRITHYPGAIKEYLSGLPAGCPVAVETIGNWYWIVDEIEAAGQRPLLVHARKAKLMMGSINKTDRLDVRGLNRLQRTGTLPTVWIPSGPLRDKRDLARTRLFLVNMRTRIKNRIHATLAKYALRVENVKDPFCQTGRLALAEVIEHLPEQTRFASRSQLAQLDTLEQEIGRLELKMKALFEMTPMVQRLRTLPGVGYLLAEMIAMEIGDIGRFASAERLASYAGTTPRVHASGGRVAYGTLRKDVNHYLKWAYVEAAHSICLNRDKYPFRHTSRLYTRLRQKKGHQKAIGAVARHLAEASWWIMTKEQKYHDPGLKQNSQPEA
jgi:transposase